MSGRILFQYIIPNSIGPIIVTVTAGVGGAITLDSGLTFLGIGVQPPMPVGGPCSVTVPAFGSPFRT